MPLLDEWVASSPSLGELAESARRAAAADAPLLILGESGAGRSSFARALHTASGRASEPLIEVDPGVVPSTLFESELFGYEAGAFTGAEGSVAGKVARAEGGTLLLDHVEEIPLAAQAKLLRLLSERRFSPLGGSERAADVRFVAVGADDLRARVDAGRFRRDLFFRLEVLIFRIPSLRERRGDLPGLTDFLLRDLADRMGVGDVWLSGAAKEWMDNYSWPGNLRQLRNCIEREMVTSGAGELDPAPPKGNEVRPRSLSEVEEQEIRRALAFTRGRQGEAAELLGISRKTLWEKRKKYGLG